MNIPLRASLTKELEALIQSGEINTSDHLELQEGRFKATSKLGPYKVAHNKSELRNYLKDLQNVLRKKNINPILSDRTILTAENVLKVIAQYEEVTESYAPAPVVSQKSIKNNLSESNQDEIFGNLLLSDLKYLTHLMVTHDISPYEEIERYNGRLETATQLEHYGANKKDNEIKPYLKSIATAIQRLDANIKIKVEGDEFISLDVYNLLRIYEKVKREKTGQANIQTSNNPAEIEKGNSLKPELTTHKADREDIRERIKLLKERCIQLQRQIDHANKNNNQSNETPESKASKNNIEKLEEAINTFKEMITDDEKILKLIDTTSKKPETSHDGQANSLIVTSKIEGQQSENKLTKKKPRKIKIGTNTSNDRPVTANDLEDQLKNAYNMKQQAQILLQNLKKKSNALDLEAYKEQEEIKLLNDKIEELNSKTEIPLTAPDYIAGILYSYRNKENIEIDKDSKNDQMDNALHHIITIRDKLKKRNLAKDLRKADFFSREITPERLQETLNKAIEQDDIDNNGELPYHFIIWVIENRKNINCLVQKSEKKSDQLLAGLKSTLGFFVREYVDLDTYVTFIDDIAIAISKGYYRAHFFPEDQGYRETPTEALQPGQSIEGRYDQIELLLRELSAIESKKKNAILRLNILESRLEGIKNKIKDKQASIKLWDERTKKLEIKKNAGNNATPLIPTAPPLEPGSTDKTYLHDPGFLDRDTNHISWRPRNHNLQKREIKETNKSLGECIKSLSEAPFVKKDTEDSSQALLNLYKKQNHNNGIFLSNNTKANKNHTKEFIELFHKGIEQEKLADGPEYNQQLQKKTYQKNALNEIYAFVDSIDDKYTDSEPLCRLAIQLCGRVRFPDLVKQHKLSCAGGFSVLSAGWHRSPLEMTRLALKLACDHEAKSDRLPMLNFKLPKPLLFEEYNESFADVLLLSPFYELHNSNGEANTEEDMHFALTMGIPVKNYNLKEDLSDNDFLNALAMASKNKSLISMRTKSELSDFPESAKNRAFIVEEFSLTSNDEVFLKVRTQGEPVGIVGNKKDFLELCKKENTIIFNDSNSNPEDDLVFQRPGEELIYTKNDDLVIFDTHNGNKQVLRKNPHGPVNDGTTDYPANGVPSNYYEAKDGNIYWNENGRLYRKAKDGRIYWNYHGSQAFLADNGKVYWKEKGRRHIYDTKHSQL